MTTEEYRSNLILKIYPLLIKMGLKTLTMDFVAKSLGMSKRTLYEIFGSKEDMIVETMRKAQAVMKQRLLGVGANAENMMVAVILVLKYHQRTMNEMSMTFFRDMDEYYPNLRTEYDEMTAANNMQHCFEAGVSEGVFRPEVDYRIMSRLFLIQMESLKRMEKHFPSDVTLLQLFNTISIGFLRSIATAKGMAILDNMSGYFDSSKSKTMAETNEN